MVRNVFSFYADVCVGGVDSTSATCARHTTIGAINLLLYSSYLQNNRKVRYTYHYM